MIREEKKLNKDILKRVPVLTEKIAGDHDVIALFIFGSAAEENLKPLSDLDFGILLSDRLNKKQRFDKHLDLIGLFTKQMGTDEIDIVIMNDTPPRFSLNIIRTGKLLTVRSRRALSDFCEQQLKRYLDFKFFRDEFNHMFLKGIGYNG